MERRDKCRLAIDRRVYPIKRIAGSGRQTRFPAVPNLSGGKMLRENIKKYTGTVALTSAALLLLTTETKPFRLLKVTLKASENITETIQVTYDSGTAAAYDTIEDSTALTAAQNYVFRPTGNDIFAAGDNVKLSCTKANTTGTVYATILIEVL